MRHTASLSTRRQRPSAPGTGSSTSAGGHNSSSRLVALTPRFRFHCACDIGRCHVPPLWRRPGQLRSDCRQTPAFWNTFSMVLGSFWYIWQAGGKYLGCTACNLGILLMFNSFLFYIAPANPHGIRPRNYLQVECFTWRNWHY